jgi:hypothetical protein
VCWNGERRIIVEGEVEIWKRSKRIPMQSAKIIDLSEDEEIRFVGTCQGKSCFYIDYRHLTKHSQIYRLYFIGLEGGQVEGARKGS